MATVMVVDDEERVRTLLAKSLSSQGHSVVTVASASAAIERLESKAVDLVVLDLVMPGLGGLAVLNAMNESKKTTPVIVLSGVTDVASRVEALDRGAVDVVSKPFSLTELLARVRRNVGLARTTPDDRWLEVGGIRLDVGRRRATFRSVSASLTEREFSLLAPPHASLRTGVPPGGAAARRLAARLRPGQQRRRGLRRQPPGQARAGHPRSRRCAASATASTRTPDGRAHRMVLLWSVVATVCAAADDRAARQRDGALPHRLGRRSRSASASSSGARAPPGSASASSPW